MTTNNTILDLVRKNYPQIAEIGLQEEIAHEVASALRVTLLGEDEARIDAMASTSPGTYDQYLQGRKELSTAGYVHLEQARDLFQQVLAEAGFGDASHHLLSGGLTQLLIATRDS